VDFSLPFDRDGYSERSQKDAGSSGSWPTAQTLPANERVTVESLLRELDHVSEDLVAIDGTWRRSR
jgi:hypothetical protein